MAADIFEEAAPVPEPLESLESSESGQAAVLLIVMLGTFLLGVFGFAVDLTNIWFHRQAAIAAADAACQAGALDILATGSGLTLPLTGFTAGTASNCVSNPLATMCSYASANGYSGTGLVADTPSNSVSWTFPATVTGVTPGIGTYPFMKLTIVENVKTYFISLLRAAHVQQMGATTTCGVTQVKGAVPLLILNPALVGTLNYSLIGALTIIGGPQRGIQVNSVSPLAVGWLPPGTINMSAGGPNGTGSDIGVVGGPTAAPTLLGISSVNGGTTGTWKSATLPLADPYGSVGVPSSILSLTPSTTTSGTWVSYGVDGCPDHSNVTLNPAQACKEFGPGYYPLGINLPLVMNGVSTAIFKPGIYYMGASLVASGTNTLRMAKPSGYLQTDGIMMYFAAGTFNANLFTGTTSATLIDNVAPTDLTCDGSSPPTADGLGTGIAGNVLYGQCSANGTYWDTGGDTTDVRSATGSRGLVIFQDHGNLSIPSLGGTGNALFGGTIYFHSTTYLDLLAIAGGQVTVVGNIVTDQLGLTGLGTLKVALSPTTNMLMSKVSVFN